MIRFGYAINIDSCWAFKVHEVKSLKINIYIFFFKFPCFECEDELPEVLKKAMSALEQVKRIL